MPDSTTRECDVADTAALLAEACERNAVIELHRKDNSESIPAARGRMLIVRDDVLYIAEPQLIGRDARLHPGTAVDAFFLAGDVMLQFTSEILSTNEMLRLNNRKRIRGFAIAAPAAITPGQRRAYYRTLVVSEGPVKVTLTPVLSIDPLQCPVDGQPIYGTLIDGSPLGFGVNAPAESLRGVKLYDLFFLSFAIPKSEEPITVLVELRQDRDLGEIGYRRLGFLNHLWPSRREHTFAMQPVLRWINDVQRRALRAA